jgi:hypothetical protein
MRDLIDHIEMLDMILMREICNDIVNGSLITEIDSETLELVLIGIWEDKESFKQRGVIVGEA